MSIHICQNQYEDRNRGIETFDETVYPLSYCGYIYEHHNPSIPFEKLPDSWTCPKCGANKDYFEEQ